MFHEACGNAATVSKGWTVAQGSGWVGASGFDLGLFAVTQKVVQARACRFDMNMMLFIDRRGRTSDYPQRLLV